MTQHQNMVIAEFAIASGEAAYEKMAKKELGVEG